MTGHPSRAPSPLRSFLLVQSAEQLHQLVQRMAQARLIALDTEFVGEYTYRPQLCLIQLALCFPEQKEPELVVVDPKATGSLESFWKQLAQGFHQTVVHAGRQDFAFCWQQVGQGPHGLFDVQVAAGLVGMDYPAGYSRLVQQVLGVRSSKRETRTDWRRRPLSAQQLQYALEDVVHLPALAKWLQQRLNSLGRQSWMQEEMQHWQQGVQQQLEKQSWRRLSGLSALSGQQLAVVRALWQWRNTVAQQENRRPGQVLRDDLIVELARRGSADPQQILAVRGMEWRRLRRRVEQIAQVIAQALVLPPQQWPAPQPRPAPEQYGTLSQLFYAVLACHARTHQVAPSLLGTPKDLRQWIAWRLHPDSFPAPPLLAQGWRKQLAGPLLEQLFQGELAVWVQDPRNEIPLRWASRDQKN